MATQKKKHLIELMIEAGVKWPEGAEHAAQDKCDNTVCFFANKPVVMAGDSYYLANGGTVGGSTQLPSLCRNWHQTIVTLEQYSEALAANVGEPVDAASKSNQVSESEDAPAVDAVEWHNAPSIEQLTSDYHAKATEADHLQAVADEALKAADEALLALEKAGELIGLVISIDTKPKQVEQTVEPAQPEITDWRDLRVGDVIFIGESLAPFTAPSGEYKVAGVDVESEIQPAAVEWGDGEVWPLLAERGWRFIRRP